MLLTLDVADLCARAHQNARRKGFYDPEPSWDNRMALLHSEISEALEAHRKSTPGTEHHPGLPLLSSKLSGVLALEEEMADLLIRVFDLCGWLGIDLDSALRAVVARREAVGFGHEFADLPRVDGLNRLHRSVAIVDTTGASNIADHANPAYPGLTFLEAACACLVLDTLDFCDTHLLRIEVAVVEKMEYNLGRPFRHGGLQS